MLEKIKFQFSIFILLISTVGMTHAYDNKDDKPINSSMELLEWCKLESQSYFAARGLKTYNWTASWWDDATLFHVKGSWRIDRDYITVECQIVKGSKQKYAIMNIMK